MDACGCQVPNYDQARMGKQKIIRYTTKITDKWDRWGEGVRLVILDSPYRLLHEPLLDYIEQLISLGQPGELITIVVPQFVPRHWWNNLLHTRAANMLRIALLFRPGIVITDVPYQVR
jgi:hypothetical protein